jgi:hypothetical protein
MNCVGYVILEAGKLLNIGLTQTYNEMLKFVPLRHKDTKFIRLSFYLNVLMIIIHKDFLVFLCDFVTLWQDYESLRKSWNIPY